MSRLVSLTPSLCGSQLPFKAWFCVPFLQPIPRMLRFSQLRLLSATRSRGNLDHDHPLWIPSGTCLAQGPVLPTDVYIQVSLEHFYLVALLPLKHIICFELIVEHSSQVHTDAYIKISVASSLPSLLSFLRDS